MKKEKLIEILQGMPEDTEVCIFDHRKNLDRDFGDGSSDGVHSDFEVEVITKENVTEDSKPFIALMFDNDDYEE